MTITDTLSAETRRRLARMDIVRATDADAPPTYATGWEQALHHTGRAVAQALNGSGWQAEGRTPYWPHPTNETHAQIAVAVDARWLVLYTHRVPAHTSRDLFSLDVNGHRIPFYIHRGDLPHAPEVIAANVFRYVHSIQIEPCHGLRRAAPHTRHPTSPGNHPAQARTAPHRLDI